MAYEIEKIYFDADNLNDAENRLRNAFANGDDVLLRTEPYDNPIEFARSLCNELNLHPYIIPVSSMYELDFDAATRSKRVPPWQEEIATGLHNAVIFDCMTAEPDCLDMIDDMMEFRSFLNGEELPDKVMIIKVALDDIYYEC